jgi:hypothetical protein
MGALQGAMGQGMGALQGAMGQAEHAVQGAVGQAEHAAQGAAGQAAGAAEHAAGAVAKHDPEEIYEQVVDRLKRDLLGELEQHGHLLREHP